jgi:anionic cell wall polymer biosynthesis LytR-Cps2A-Psr (LCP) family protein
MKTIEHNFDIKIDYYVRVGFESFKKAVNAIGGIDIKINKDNYDHFRNRGMLNGLTKEQATDGTHTIHLNGESALDYARNRTFPAADFTRTLHQRDLLTQVFNSMKSSSLSEIHGVLEAVLPYVATDMPKDVLRSMVWSSLEYLSYDLSNARMPCADSFRLTRIRGMSVVQINVEANSKYLKAVIYG